jgi:hypothetical protein
MRSLLSCEKLLYRIGKTVSELAHRAIHRSCGQSRMLSEESMDVSAPAEILARRGRISTGGNSPSFLYSTKRAVGVLWPPVRSMRCSSIWMR